MFVCYSNIDKSHTLLMLVLECLMQAVIHFISHILCLVTFVTAFSLLLFILNKIGSFSAKKNSDKNILAVPEGVWTSLPLSCDCSLGVRFCIGYWGVKVWLLYIWILFIMVRILEGIWKIFYITLKFFQFFHFCMLLRIWTFPCTSMLLVVSYRLPISYLR